MTKILHIHDSSQLYTLSNSFFLSDIEWSNRDFSPNCWQTLVVWWCSLNFPSLNHQFSYYTSTLSHSESQWVRVSQWESVSHSPENGSHYNLYAYIGGARTAEKQLRGGLLVALHYQHPPPASFVDVRAWTVRGTTWSYNELPSTSPRVHTLPE